jgi:hypothetical protein
MLMLKVGLYNISIRADSIDSDLSDFLPWEYADSLEMLILSHYTSGINVSSNEYQEGILAAVNSLKNNLK